MELQEFITETLTQIVAGINDANEKLKDQDSFVPDAISQTPKDHEYMGYHCGNSFHLLTNIHFDISIDVSETTNKEKKAGLCIHSSGVGIGKNNAECQSTGQNIKFTLPLAIPNRK